MELVAASSPWLKGLPAHQSTSRGYSGWGCAQMAHRTALQQSEDDLFERPSTVPSFSTRSSRQEVRLVNCLIWCSATLAGQKEGGSSGRHGRLLKLYCEAVIAVMLPTSVFQWRRTILEASFVLASRHGSEWDADMHAAHR